MRRNLACILLALSLILLIPSGVFAADLDDSLLVHYDFLGSTEEERLSDKAGDSSENLTRTALNDGNTYVDNGRAVVDGTKPGNYFASSFDLASGDFTRLTTEATVFLVTKTYNTAAYGGWDDFLHIEGLSRVVVASSSGINGNGNIGIRSNQIWGTQFDFTTTNALTGATYTSNQWIYMAITYSLNTDTNLISVTYYVSYDNGKTYSFYEGRDVTPFVKGKVFSDDKGNQKLALQLGEVISATPLAKAANMSFEYKDFRLYNKALSLKDIQSLRAEGDADTVTPTAALYKGVQESSVTDDTFNVRFVATVDALSYEETGFEITATYTAEGTPGTKDMDKACSYVYHKLTGRAASGIEEYTALNLGGKYLMALTVNDIPANIGIISFEVTPYTVQNGVTSYGDKYIVIYNNGVFQSQNKA